MRNVYLPTADGGSDLITTYDISDFPWLNMPEALLKTKHKKHPGYYFKLFATFDIETTTIEDERYSKFPIGFMYHWQMCLGGLVVCGRTWGDWFKLLNRVMDWINVDYDHRLVIYVHNLGYEFQFIKDFLIKYYGGIEVFATEKRKPLRVVCANGLEFRCSYRLSNMSLEKATKNELGVKHIKASGDLDYKIKRTPVTPLTDREFGYCVADVLSLYEYIEHKMKNESDNLDSIPMTSTGYVRRDCRRACRLDLRYRDEVFNKCLLTVKPYELLKEAGRGGNTHGNRYLAGRIIHDADSFDAISDYPAQMFKKYPMSQFVYYGRIETMGELHTLLNEKACLFRVVFKNLRLREEIAMPYISFSKAIGYTKAIKKGRKVIKQPDRLLDNGRILKADALALTLTDIDYKIIEKQYTWDAIAIADFHIATYDYLPESLLGQVREYFRQKTELKIKIKKCKDPEEKKNLKYLYAKSKNRLNGIFGMCYTDPVRQTILLNEDGTWDNEEVNIAEALEKYNNSRNSFLVYAWGVWCTCWARDLLEKIFDIAGRGAIYGDTDSCKCVGIDNKKVEALNEELKAYAEEREAYVDVEGKRYYMGLFEKENEEPIQEFLTLGAKKYVYTDEEGLHLTISGVSKQKGAEELGDIHNFKPGFTFKDSAGSTLYYNDDVIREIEVDGVKIETASNIGMVDSTYTIGITKEYGELINYNYLE